MVTATSPRVDYCLSNGGTILARRTTRKKANKNAQTNVDERGSPSSKSIEKSRSKIEGVTEGDCEVYARRCEQYYAI